MVYSTELEYLKVKLKIKVIILYTKINPCSDSLNVANLYKDIVNDITNHNPNTLTVLNITNFLNMIDIDNRTLQQCKDLIGVINGSL